MGMAAILVMWPGPFEQTHRMETPYEIWLQSTKWFLRRRCLQSVDDGRTDRRTTEAYLFHKLTNEPSAQMS